MGPIVFAVYTQILQAEVYPVYEGFSWVQFLPPHLRRAFSKWQERRIRSVK